MNSAVKTLSFALLAAFSANLFAADAAPAEKPAAAPGPSPAKQAIAVRKAAFTLIANSFKGIGDASQGKAEYNQADIEKRAKRVLVLSEFLDGAFPDASNVGEPDTKTLPAAWSDKADFEKKLKDFQEHAATLVKVAATEKTASAAFKEAAGAVAKDCKGCHDSYKAK
ncbi:MAG TPA: cytochrome c [Cellvibrio sp.]|nr:cytochrome c [Cellvibrio sp.]